MVHMSVIFDKEMTIEIFVIFGYLITLSHEAAIISLPTSIFNRSLDADSDTINQLRPNLHDVYPPTDYLRLPPGANIYFYKIKDDNFLLGHKLQSDDEIDISFVISDRSNQITDVKTSVSDTLSYIALKSGILLPRGVKKSLLYDKRNNCVYQSIKPAYYVKGFKGILIPADILYSKSLQNEIFSNRSAEFSNWNCDKANADISIESSVENEVKRPTLDNEEGWSSSALDEKTNKIEDSDIFPDKTCGDEVTLFLLKSDGVFKRVTSDPYMPLGLHLKYSLLDNFVLQPKFLGGSDLVLSYVTGDNGDLIPHPKNSHKITAELGSSVLFMLSKNGGLFPVKEEIKRGKFTGYYFDGRLIHETRQSLNTYSNSTVILINKEKFQLFDRDTFKIQKNKFSHSMISEPEIMRNTEYDKVNSNHHGHRLRKREAYYNGYERDSADRIQPLMEPNAEGRHLSPEPNRIIECTSPPARHHGCFSRRQHSASGSERLCRNPSADARYADVAEDHMPEPGKLVTSVMGPFEEIRKPYSGQRNVIYSEPTDQVEQDRDEISDSQLAHPVWDRSLLRPRTDIFIFDEKGTRIRLIPEITDSDDVVIYKLTCKGNLVRYPSCKEPEFGFEINFQLLLDEFVLVPTVSVNKPFHITYVLQENGDLVPAEGNANTFRKAPGSLIYYMLGKNNVLFPVQQVIDMDGNVSFFYQDFFLLKMKDTVEKPLHFTTKGAPLFAFFNGLTMISMSSRPRLKSRLGSNWNQLKPSEQLLTPPKTMYLTGPKGELVRVVPYKNRQGSTVVYELDCNGILYRSPKDKKKCIILKSYILLKEGILLPSNDTNGYVYMMSKNGDLFPYLYPDGKIEAPLASSLKYVLCEKGILLPIKLEIVDNYICYIFREAIMYKERVYCRTCLDRLSEKQLYGAKNYKKSSCDIPINNTNNSNESDIKLFVNKNGEYVFYRKENKLLKRYPPEAVPSYLKYTMGSFEVKPDGSLYQIRYRDPCENVANLMLEPNGDLLEDTRNVNNIRSEYYVLDTKGNLISVEARKTKKSLYFFKGHRRVCKVSFPIVEPAPSTSQRAQELSTPLGKDPLKLMDDPFPEGKSDAVTDTRSLYIPIPLKSVSVSNTPTEPCKDCNGDPEHQKKCDMLKDTLKQVSQGNSLPLALELELTDDIIEELKNWAAKCDKVLKRRDVNADVEAYIKAINNLRAKKGTMCEQTR